MIQLQISVEINPHKRLEFEQAACMMLEGKSISQRWLSYALYQQLEHHNLYYYTEEWQSRKALDSHMASDDFHALLGAMKVLGKILEARIVTSDRVETFSSI